MLLAIPDVLTTDELAKLRALLDAGEWVDGATTAGGQAALAKRNEQLREGGTAARDAAALVRKAVDRSQLFLAAALPSRMTPALFNRYASGQTYGAHVDNAIRAVAGTRERLRADIAATLFLSMPEDYDGGVLTIDGSYGVNRVKLPAGQLALYPADSLHRVTPVTRGVRVAAVFWVQSLVRAAADRALLFQLDTTIQRLGADRGLDDEEVVRLTALYHNLLRRWSEL